MGRYAGQFMVPHNIAADSQGSLYISEVDTGQRVQRFRPVDRALMVSPGALQQRWRRGGGWDLGWRSSFGLEAILQDGSPTGGGSLNQG